MVYPDQAGEMLASDSTEPQPMVVGCLVKLLWTFLFFVVLSIFGLGVIAGAIFAPYLK